VANENPAERLASEIARLDQLLVLVVLVFAFFLGSFISRNSDFWRHLATGRLMAEGRYQFGTDPFAYTSPDTRWAWINHAWLPDWIVYHLTELAGGAESVQAGALLVTAKALLVAALAGVLLLIRAPGQSLWIPVACVALAIYVMSPWLFLQPKCLSLLLLATTLWLLHKPKSLNPLTWRRRLFVLPFLFALWANLDEWFLLGPITVALYFLGEMLQQFVMAQPSGETKEPPGQWRILALVLAVGIAACLINPFHVHVFVLPPELWALRSSDLLGQDLALRGILSSPLRGEYVTNPRLGWGYFLWSGLGILSFCFNRAALLGGRTLVWLAFWLISLRLERMIPFFAVIGGAITGLNFQEAVAQRFGAKLLVSRAWRNWSLLGRLGTVVAGLVLLGLAWPGWLHPDPDLYRRTHRVAWAIDIDPSLSEAARELGRLRQRGVLPEAGHGFNFSLDFANYCAWFCPGAKSFFDTRIQLFGDTLTTYLQVKEGLQPKPDGSPRNPAQWQKIFRDDRYCITHVIAGGQDASIAVVFRLWLDQLQWTLLYSDGTTSIFGWSDPSHPQTTRSFQKHALNLNQLAFGPNLPASQRVPEEAPPAPHQRTVWSSFWKAPDPRPVEVNRAALYLDYYQIVALQWPWPVWVAGLVGGWATPTNPIWKGGEFAFDPFTIAHVNPIRLDFLVDRLARQGNLGPPAPLLLAVRAARRAVFATPDDSKCYLLLAKAYLQLWENLERPWTGDQSQLLNQVRQIQIITALRHALVLQPDDPGIHERMMQLYRQMDVETLIWHSPGAGSRTPFLDLTLEHFRELIKLIKAHGKASVEKAEEFTKRIGRIEDELKELEKELHRRRDQWEVDSRNKPALEQASRAIHLGLVGQALAVLKSELDKGQLSGQEASLAANLLVHLYLATGQVDQILESEILPPDPWSRILLAAAIGDYATADQYLDEEYRNAVRTSTLELLSRVRIQTFVPNPQALIGAPLIPLNWAELAVLRGVLALEAGHTAKAGTLLGQGLTLSASAGYTASQLTSLAADSPLNLLVLQAALAKQRLGPWRGFPIRPLAVRYLRLLQAAGNPQ
jgi:hypothetical protein